MNCEKRTDYGIFCLDTHMCNEGEAALTKHFSDKLMLVIIIS